MWKVWQMAQANAEQGYDFFRSGPAFESCVEEVHEYKGRVTFVGSVRLCGKRKYKACEFVADKRDPQYGKVKLIFAGDSVYFDDFEYANSIARLVATMRIA